jgi:hypothetical protein
LLLISYEGACVIAAHQYLRAQGEKGYQAEKGGDVKRKLVLLGSMVIEYFLRMSRISS